MSIITENAYIVDEYGAVRFLIESGFTRWDIEEFRGMLAGETLEKYESLKDEFHFYELSLDAAQGALNDVLNLCSELMDKAHTKEAHNALQSVYDLVYYSEAI